MVRLLGRSSSVATLLLAALALLAVSPAAGVDRHKFRTCAQTDFCKRLRSNNENHKSMDYRISEVSGNGEGERRQERE